jgi:hypothetical protein
MLSINTATQRKVYDVEIDGHHYKVRKMGAGERLSIGQAYKRLDTLNKLDKLSEAQESETVELSAQIFKTMAAIFDDQQDGKVRDKLFSEADDDVIQMIFKQVFEMQNANTGTDTSTTGKDS